LVAAGFGIAAAVLSQNGATAELKQDPDITAFSHIITGGGDDEHSRGRALKPNDINNMHRNPNDMNTHVACHE
jgi:hypothetical protein